MSKIPHTQETEESLESWVFGQILIFPRIQHRNLLSCHVPVQQAGNSERRHPPWSCFSLPAVQSTSASAFKRAPIWLAGLHTPVWFLAFVREKKFPILWIGWQSQREGPCLQDAHTFSLPVGISTEKLRYVLSLCLQTCLLLSILDLTGVKVIGHDGSEATPTAGRPNS